MATERTFFRTGVRNYHLVSRMDIRRHVGNLLAVILCPDCLIVVLGLTCLGTLDNFGNDFTCLTDYHMASFEQAEIVNHVPVV